MVNFIVGKKDKTSSIVSYLGPNTLLQGTIHCDYSLHLDGRLEGVILSNNDVIIGDSAVINGEIKAKNVFVSGKVIGNIEVTNSLQILATGRVEGDIVGAKLDIKEGGIYKGKVNMDVIESQSIYEDTFQVVRK